MNEAKTNRDAQQLQIQIDDYEDQLPPAQEVSRLTALLVGASFFCSAGFLVAVEAVLH